MRSKRSLILATLSLSIAVTAFLMPSTCQAIDLVDETGTAHTVPKDKFFVFIFIGHSNVSSVNKDAADGWKDLRAWNYRWDSGSKHTWVQAKETPALGLTRRGTGGPAMVLLKRLVKQDQWKDLHFGIVQNAKPSSTCQFKSPDPWHNTDYDRYKEGKGLHNEIVSLVNEIKGDVTIAGIVVQLGWIETRVAYRNAYDITKLGSDLTATIQQLRKAVAIPNLPAFLLRVETDSLDAQAFQTDLLQKAYAQIAHLDTPSSRMAHIDIPLRPAPLSFAGDYMDVHHFGTRGHTKTMDQVIREMQRRHWGPSGKTTAPAFVTQPKDLSVTQGTSVTLTAEVSGFPYPSFQWMRDGVPIVAATASQYTFFAYRSGEKYTVRITNSLGHKDSQGATITVAGSSSNHPPVTVADTLLGKVDQSIVVPASDLLANDSDPDAKDRLHFAGVGSRSDKGGKLGLFGPAVVYSPPGGFSGEDHFAYLVSDKQGARRRGEVSIQVGDKERIEIVSPAPGELEQGSKVPIRWSTTLKALRIEWSTSGKDGPWMLVGNADATQASWPGFTWTVPAKATETAYLRLSAGGSSPTAIGGPYALIPPSDPGDSAIHTDRSPTEAPRSDDGCSCNTTSIHVLSILPFFFVVLFFYRRRAR